MKIVFNIDTNNLPPTYQGKGGRINVFDFLRTYLYLNLIEYKLEADAMENDDSIKIADEEICLGRALMKSMAIED